MTGLFLVTENKSLDLGIKAEIEHRQEGEDTSYGKYYLEREYFSHKAISQGG
jgi:hypothetical protein